MPVPVLLESWISSEPLERNPAGMWCSICRSDVSVRTTGHAGGLLCSRCGHDLLTSTKPTDAIRQAREILERWNSSDLFERISRTESLDSLPTRFDSILKPGALQHSLTADTLESVSPKKARADAEAATTISTEFVVIRLPEPPVLPEESIVVVSEFSEDERIAEAAVAEFSETNDHDTIDHKTSPGDLPQVSSAQVEVLQGDSASIEPAAKDHDSLIPDNAKRTDSILYESNESGMGGLDRQQRQDDESELAPAQTSELAAEEALETKARELSAGDPAISSAPAPRLFDISELTHIGVIGVTTVANVRRISAMATQEPGPADLAQSLVPAAAAVVISEEDSEQGPPKPAETANVSELLTADVPKKISRSSVRRPLLHRRFQLERPATTSSTGSDTVNRNLRVDQPGGSNDVPEAAQQEASIPSSVAPETRIVSNSPKPGKRFRIDGPESVDTVTGTDGRRARTQTLPKHRYIDDAHESTLRGPHFEVSTPRRSNLTSVTGQFLAYLGVLGLTIGTAMVIYGHFGGYSEYTPTGWLVTTVAQMLLFLGVINLVSGGIEQNNDEVSRRINTLGDQLLRIEQVTSEVLKGPKISPHRYANPDAEVEESTRETIDIDRR